MQQGLGISWMIICIGMRGILLASVLLLIACSRSGELDFQLEKSDLNVLDIKIDGQSSSGSVEIADIGLWEFSPETISSALIQIIIKAKPSRTAANTEHELFTFWVPVDATMAITDSYAEKVIDLSQVSLFWTTPDSLITEIEGLLYPTLEQCPYELRFDIKIPYEFRLVSKNSGKSEIFRVLSGPAGELTESSSDTRKQEMLTMLGMVTTREADLINDPRDLNAAVIAYLIRTDMGRLCNSTDNAP